MRLPLAACLVASLALACRSTPEAGAPQPAPASAHRLEIPDLFELVSKTKLQTKLLGWTSDSSAWLTIDGGKVTAVDAASGARRVLIDPAALERACGALPGLAPETAKRFGARTDFTWSADRSLVLWNDEHDLFSYSLAGGTAARLTDDAREEVGEALSPDGKWVAYVADWNLWIAPADGSAPPRALTTAGDLNHLYGRLDWIYQEEVYGRGNFGAFWWSPDSRRIAFLVLDESAVPSYVVTDHRGIEPRNETWRYPKAGDPNPRATLHVVDAAGGAARDVDLAPWAAAEPLIVRVGWTPDASGVVFQVQDRVQTWLDLAVADPASGAARKLFRDRTPTWIDPCDGPWWLDGGARFLWRSERDGWAHLYLYRADGELVGRVTQGAFEVDGVDHVDAAAGRVVFLCDRDDVKGAQLYRCALDGSALERLTAQAGTHAVSFAPDGRRFLDTYSALSSWPVLSLCDADGKLVREIERVDGALAREKGVLPPRLVHPRTRDGVELEALLFEPPGFDPARKYPVLVHTYAGPHSPKVKDAPLGFDGFYHALLAQRGFRVFVCDPRSGGGRGLVSEQAIYKDLGSRELADLEDAVDWLVQQGGADPARIGLWGWSYGGYETAFALTHSKRFALGIAGAPVTDWRLYDSIYTERYMDLPQANPAGYDKSSVLEAAANLSGKLLVIHGVIDENVHLQNTLNLVEKLQLAGKPFELMLYPGNRHPVVNEKQKTHLYAMMARFVEDNL